MSNLKLWTNILRSSSSRTGLIRHNNQLRQQQLWCLKRVANYSTAVFIRNTNGSAHLAGNISNKESFKRHSLLLPQFQNHCCALEYNARCKIGTKNAPDRANKSDTKSAAITEADIFGEASKLGLFARFKLMYKKYWYVLIPVHIVTSTGWICGFYYLSKSGVDIAAVLEYLHLNQSLIEKLHSSNLGHWAVAYLLYKVATPLRYAVTLGGTTVSIKYLVQHGYIKPIPSRDDFVRMYEEQKAHRAAVKAEKDLQQEKEDQQHKEKK